MVEIEQSRETVTVYSINGKKFYREEEAREELANLMRYEKEFSHFVVMDNFDFTEGRGFFRTNLVFAPTENAVIQYFIHLHTVAIGDLYGRPTPTFRINQSDYAELREIAQRRDYDSSRRKSVIVLDEWGNQTEHYENVRGIDKVNSVFRWEPS